MKSIPASASLAWDAVTTISSAQNRMAFFLPLALWLFQAS
jgi:hypothetical protein